MLCSLEKETTGENKFSYEDDYIEEISFFYDFDYDKTKILLHPNFAIIYEDIFDKVIIGDLFFNVMVKNKNDKEYINITDIIVTQISNDLSQIIDNRDFEIFNLEESQENILKSSLELLQNGSKMISSFNQKIYRKR